LSALDRVGDVLVVPLDPGEPKGLNVRRARRGHVDALDGAAPA
jgi:hypothetical protein